MLRDDSCDIWMWLAWFSWFLFPPLFAWPRNSEEGLGYPAVDAFDKNIRGYRYARAKASPVLFTTFPRVRPKRIIYKKKKAERKKMDAHCQNGDVSFWGIGIQKKTEIRERINSFYCTIKQLRILTSMRINLIRWE